MPRLIVKFTHQKNQVFELQPGEYLVGRGEHADLVLPNVSVSREHARVVVEGPEAVRVVDMGSSNGVLINGQPAAESPTLASGDELQIGRYGLVFLSDAPKDRFYRGRCVSYLPRYQASTAMVPDINSTFALSSDALRMIHKGNRICEHAKLVSEADSNKFWYPEDRGLTFGGKGLITVRGWFTWGLVAELLWDGKSHVLHRRSAFATVKVGEEKIWSRPLRNGDRVRIGATYFRYDAPR